MIPSAKHEPFEKNAYSEMGPFPLCQDTDPNQKRWRPLTIELDEKMWPMPY